MPIQEVESIDEMSEEEIACLVDRVERQRLYRKLYAKRPEVKARHRAYNAKRTFLVKQLKAKGLI
jgi:hypothetical protein